MDQDLPANEVNVVVEPVEPAIMTPEAPLAAPEATDLTLEAKMAGALKATFGDDYEGADPAALVENETPSDAEDAGDAEDPPASETPVTPGAAADPDAPTLPDSYRRSLVAYGWDDAAIDRNLRALGADFISTAARIHDNRNQEVASWAEAGRRARDQQQAQSTPGQPGSSAAATPSGAQVLAPIDVQALQQEYGQDELITRIVGPVNAVIDRLNGILPALQQGQKTVADAAMDSLYREIGTFFGRPEVKDVSGGFYGHGSPQMTPEQVENRNQMLEHADALMISYGNRNKQLGLQEAMMMAHDAVSSQFKTAVVRAGIQQEAKTRNRGLTQKPTNRGKGNTSPTHTPLERKVASGLAGIFK